jgi:hypothetical protein
MNRRQPATRPPAPQQQQQPQQRRGTPASTPPSPLQNMQGQTQIPAQVSIPQAISILVARINQLENRVPSMVEPVVDNSEVVDELSQRIARLESELFSAKDHIMKLQSVTLDLAKSASASASSFVSA